jgi:hypothetical protein
MAVVQGWPAHGCRLGGGTAMPMFGKQNFGDVRWKSEMRRVD